MVEKFWFYALLHKKHKSHFFHDQWVSSNLFLSPFVQTLAFSLTCPASDSASERTQMVCEQLRSSLWPGNSGSSHSARPRPEALHHRPASEAGVTFLLPVKGQYLPGCISAGRALNAGMTGGHPAKVLLPLDLGISWEKSRDKVQSGQNVWCLGCGCRVVAPRICSLWPKLPGGGLWGARGISVCDLTCSPCSGYVSALTGVQASPAKIAFLLAAVGLSAHVKTLQKSSCARDSLKSLTGEPSLHGHFRA